MNLNIREAVESDKDFIIYSNRAIDEASYIENSKLKENIERDIVDSNKCVCLIAEENDKKVGMTLFSKVYWADRGEGVYISQIYVEPEYRNKGVMKRFLKKIFDFYGETEFVTCLVSRKNEKMLFCMNKLGFEDENMASFAVNKSDFIYNNHFDI